MNRKDFCENDKEIHYCSNFGLGYLCCPHKYQAWQSSLCFIHFKLTLNAQKFHENLKLCFTVKERKLRAPRLMNINYVMTNHKGLASKPQNHKPILTVVDYCLESNFLTPYWYNSVQHKGLKEKNSGVLQ